MAREKNIITYKKPLQINIGLVIFFVISIYIVFHIFQYLTTDSIAAYEVTQGSIAANNTYRGLILRAEQVVYAGHSGYVNYYKKSGTRASVSDAICSVDTKGDIYKQISESSDKDNTLSMDSIREISSDIDTFTESYQSSDFATAVNFKEDLSSTLLQMVNNAALDQLGDKVVTASENNTFFLLYPEHPGIVAYYTDGYEGITADDFSASLMDASTYSKSNLNVNEQVNASDAVYKIITDESWSIFIEISEETAASMAEKSSVKIRFCEDDFETTARCSVLSDGGSNFLKLSLQTAMVRYINERFIDVELVVNEESGLKIPKTAITTKEFFTVPIDAFTQGGDSDSYGLLITTTTEDGEQISFVTPTVYYATEEYYYIDDEDVTLGDVVLYDNSSRKYTIGMNTDTLTGVYNINKGYAVFKQINIMYENEDYVIVEPKTSYGVALYDHIALDGSKLTENQLVVK